MTQKILELLIVPYEHNSLAYLQEAVKKRKWIVCAKAFVGLVGDHDAEMCSYILPDALKQAPIKISQAFNCFLDALTQVRRVKGSVSFSFTFNFTLVANYDFVYII